MFFFVPSWWVKLPDSFHLFAAIGLTHVLVIEVVFRFPGFGGPDDSFGGVGEVTAAQVGGRIGFLPGDVVEDFEPELLHSVADGENDVMGAGDPDGAVGFEDALAASEPFGVELVVFLRASGFVPIAFVHFNHFAGVAGYTAVGEEVGRVGENHVEPAIGVLLVDGVEDGEGVAVEK